MKWEYKVKGIVHAGMVNPWKVNKEGVFEKPTKEINKLAKEGWELVTAIPAGNNDRGVYIFKRKKS